MLVIVKFDMNVEDVGEKEKKAQHFLLLNVKPLNLFIKFIVNSECDTKSHDFLHY